MAFGHTGSWDGYSTLIYHDSIKDRTIIILENFHQSTDAVNNIFEILDGHPLTREYEKKIVLKEPIFMKFTGTYTDNAGHQHIITYKDMHLIYNTDNIQWDMRFFP